MEFIGKKIESNLHTKYGCSKKQYYKMSNTMNTKNFESQIMAELAEIRAIVSNMKSSPSMKEKKSKKAKDPNAEKKPPSDWIVFTGKVRAALKSANKPAGKEAQQFASHLKANFPDPYNMDESEMLAAHEDWTPPEKPKEDKKEDKPAAPAASDVPKPKAVRKPMSEEKKAEMAAKRKATIERKKAEAAAGK